MATLARSSAPSGSGSVTAINPRSAPPRGPLSGPVPATHGSEGISWVAHSCLTGCVATLAATERAARPAVAEPTAGAARGTNSARGNKHSKEHDLMVSSSYVWHELRRRWSRTLVTALG